MQSRDGWYHQKHSSSIKPTGTNRILNIFVNIIYDDTPNLDPAKDDLGTYWPNATIQGINNESIPTYLSDFMDINYSPGQLNGMITKLFHESSFGRLVLLGDFMIVNINQSYIKPNSPGANFSQSELIDKVFTLINSSIGLSTIYGHNSLADYDSDSNNKIDIVQFLVRNVRNDSIANFGGVNFGAGNILPNRPYSLKVHGQITLQHSVFSYQGIGTGISQTLNPTGIITHELSHALLGGNNFHTSGGNHYTGGGTNTFFGTEGGYGLMGASNSGLVSCNGYERWRMNWTHQDPAINPTGNPIQARHLTSSTGIPSDIKKEDGPKSFILRDFVTYGDVVRIQLPYKDGGASNQYIWLENHQIGRNGKLDFLHYSLFSNGEVWYPCRPMGTPGIYSYIQVGKDLRDGPEIVVYPTNETDNLRIISAEGNWDYTKLNDENPMCIRWGLSRTEKRDTPNPLTGYQDQTEHFFPSNSNQLILLGGKNGNQGHVNIKYNSENQEFTNRMPYLGDHLDAFTGIRKMGIGTNPTPVNLVTHYVTQSHDSGIFTKQDNHRDNNHVYLSGLKIVMTERPDHTFRVDVSWDDYDVTENVRWAGNIVLKEQVILKAGKTITLDQSLTPNQINRDPVSNLFAKPTVFRCEENSKFILEQDSELKLINKSTLVLKSGSRLEIGHNAVLSIRAGDTLKIEPCAKLVIKGNGLLSVANGGVLCISPGAVVATDRGMPNLLLNVGMVIPAGYIHPNQIVPPSNTISGYTTWNNRNYFANNITINNGGNLTITNSNIRFSDIESMVTIKPGGRLTINGSTLTNTCGAIWKGIYVEGNRNLSQTFANQGALILQNGAVIENAHDAVVLRSQQSNWGHNGGIVQATNATFRNNWRDVEFNSYPLTSISFFQGCTFETTPQILHQLTNSHVSMWDVQGVNFSNCTFTDTRPNIDYYSYRKSRNGIYGHHAAFVVDNCNFNAMKYGIYAISPDAVRTFKVYDSDFSGFLGVYFSGMDNAHIVNNTFFVKPGYMYSGPGQETYGLYVENSQNFEITGNILTSSGSQAPSFNSFGVIARNTGTIHQEIYRNDFTGFSNAIQAIGNNRSTGGEGLEIRCNRFYNNHSLDILIKTDPALNPLVPQGIRELQGLRNPYVMNHFLAGNIFGSNTFFTNHGLPIYYFHHNPGSHQNLLPNHFSTKITFVEPYTYTYNYSTSCPVKQISRSTQQLLTEMEEGIQGQRETETRLAEMTDGGNTQLMLQQVQLTNSFTAYDTYKHLMNTSPWLSQEVLASVASTTDGLNHAMIRDILVANPQSAKSDQVIKALENRKDPLPAYMLAQIEAGKEKWGEMELLQQQVIGYKTAYDRALNEMVRNHMHEGDNKGLDAVDNLLAGIEDIRYQYWLAELAYSRGEHKKGAQLLQTIGKEIDNKDEYETYNHQMYIDYYALLNKWTDEEKYPGFTGLPQEALDELKRFVNTGHRVSGKALAILLLNDAIQYQEPIYYPEEEMVKKSAPAIPSIPAVASPEASESFLFRLFPNPGRDYITLEWCMEQEHATGSRIEIFSAAGVPVQSIAIDEPCNQAVFSLENLQGGNYVARLVSGHKIKNISFVISR
jgi:hypothetical protein